MVQCKTNEPPTATRNAPCQIMKVAHLLGFRWALGGLIAGPIVHVIHCTIIGYKQHELYDICYRLRFNKKQLFIDRATVFCSIPALYAYKSYGWVFGMNIGLITAVIYNTFFWKHTYQLFKDRASDFTR